MFNGEVNGIELEEELRDYLHSMTKTGAINSTGVFTIDVKAALPKLEKFQLPKPYFGVLKVIQSAVSSRASRIETVFNPWGIQVHHDGDSLTEENLKNLLNYLLSGDRTPEKRPLQNLGVDREEHTGQDMRSLDERSLRDLAVGLNTSLGRGARWVEVASRHPMSSSWSRQRWSSREDSKQWKALKSSDWANVEFIIRSGASDVASSLWDGAARKDLIGMIRGARETLTEDAQAVFDRCRFAPVTIRINGKDVAKGTLSQEVWRYWSPFKTVLHRRGSLAECYVQVPDDERSVHFLSGTSAALKVRRLKVLGRFDGSRFHALGEPQAVESELEPWCCLAVLSVRDGVRAPGEVIFVKDGVEIARILPPKFPKGVQAVVVTEGLKLDLSQFRVVDGPELQERLSWIAATARAFVLHLVKNATYYRLMPQQVDVLSAIAEVADA